LRQLRLVQRPKQYYFIKTIYQLGFKLPAGYQFIYSRPLEGVQWIAGGYALRDLGRAGVRGGNNYGVAE
jgi:hypothetical protein